MTLKKTRWWLPGLLCLILGPALAAEVPVHDCDRLAAHPEDSNKVGPGVHWNLLDPERAVPACEAAVRDFPQVPRKKYQYARSLLKKGDNDAAFRLYREIAEREYPAAQSTLGSLYLEGRGAPQDDAEAVKWFRKEAEQGFASGQNRLGLSDEETREIGGALDLGPVRFELSQAIETDFDEDDSAAWSSRTRRWKAAVTLGLDETRMAGDGGGDFSLEGLLPSSITFTGERGKVALAHAPDGPEDLETTFGVNLTWDWGGVADTSLGFYQTNYDSREIGAESADDVDRSLDISQGFYGDNWDVSAYLSLNDYRYLETGFASRDRMYSGGISFSLLPENLPDLSVFLDVDGFDSIYFDDDYSSGDQSWSLDAVLDFSKFLPLADADRKPYLKLTYDMEGAASEDSEAGTSADWGFAVLLSGGFRF